MADSNCPKSGFLMYKHTWRLDFKPFIPQKAFTDFKTQDPPAICILLSDKIFCQLHLVV